MDKWIWANGHGLAQFTALEADQIIDMGLSLRAASLDWKYLKNPFVVITDTAGKTTDLIL
ncbi:hypothetical protein DY000_02061757 [Brassica cretica]|uniref:Uncharacterized protein n=1 Tax=Brassica cretica TaxID=69181 RepID=A0ABQ7AXJ8_BRACR|nr:hypothetical protein DY000_02061757 [Brassica cretica]